MDFQRFLDSAAIELDISTDLIFDLSLLRCSCFIHHVVMQLCYSKCSVKLASLWGRPNHEYRKIS